MMTVSLSFGGTHNILVFSSKDSEGRGCVKDEVLGGHLSLSSESFQNVNVLKPTFYSYFSYFNHTVVLQSHKVKLLRFLLTTKFFKIRVCA